MNQLAGKQEQVGGVPAWMVALADVALVNLGLYGAFIIVTGELQGFQIEALIILLPIISLFAVLLFGNLGLYTRWRSGFLPVLRSLVTGVAGLTLFSILYAYWTRAFIFEQAVFLAAPLFQLFLLTGWRYLHWRLDLWVHGRRRLLVVGSRSESDRALEKITCLPRGLFAEVRLLAPERLANLPAAVEGVDSVLIAGPLGTEGKNRVVRESLDQGRELFIVPDLYEILLTGAVLSQVHDTPVIECRGLQPSFSRRLNKRLFDLAGVFLLAGPALLLLLPALLAVRWSSPGPVFYSQERVGEGGRIFTLYKLRTMVVGAEEESGPVLAAEEDHRVTRVGRFLRAVRLDELPQLFNVLRGDLSLVGPRPERPFFVEQFSRELPGYALRHLVKPGITGLAQVAGYYATNTADKLRYDLHYLQDQSLLTDLRIILRTVPTIFSGEASRGLGLPAEEHTPAKLEGGEGRTEACPRS